MTLNKREKIMIEIPARPLECIHFMTDRTIFRNTCLDMIWVCRGQIIIAVAINTFYALNIESYKCLRFMTVRTICCPVRSKQWESAHPVNFGYIIHQPRRRVMTSSAIEPGSSLVHIIVTLIAFSLRLRKNQRGMTLTATYISMLTGQDKFSFVMVK
jgi:hypothetical protein